MSNLMVLRRLVRSRIGVPETDRMFPDEIVDDNINLALLSLENEHRWPWREVRVEGTFTGGVAEQELPEDWSATKAITVEHSALEFMVDYDMERFSANYSGIPRWYTIVGRNLRVAPFPSTDYPYRHLYYKAPVMLTADKDVPLVPIEHQGALIAKAAHLLSIRQDDRAAAGPHLAEYMQEVERMKSELTRRSTRPVGRRIRDNPWVY